jgi:hypothetical protein
MPPRHLPMRRSRGGQTPQVEAQEDRAIVSRPARPSERPTGRRPSLQGTSREGFGSHIPLEPPPSRQAFPTPPRPHRSAKSQQSRLTKHTFATPDPTAATSPTPSRPRMWGSGGLAGYIPRARNASAGFSAANLTLSSTCAGPGRGSGTSSSRSLSPPS